MFEQTLIPVGRTKRPWAVVVAFLGQLAGVGILLLIPMLFVESLPMQEFVRVLVAPTPPPPPPPPPLPAPKLAKAPRVAPRQFDASVLFAPRAIPKEVAVIKDSELPPPASMGGVVGGVPGGVPGGEMGGVIGGIVGAMAAPAPPPPPEKAAPPKKVDTPQQIRVSGAVEAGLLVRQVQPEYPLIARRSRVEGTVVLKAIIGRDGTVEKLTLISGQPLFVQAAIDAVRQWLYKPTYLNGEAVEVITEIDVNFHMMAAR